ncbi:MAG: nitrous oxide reductase family maturation protein NosD [Bacterioplanes sp.]|nr:nitrous oxide reductase family maturation protein NosD [Bacterioplanes sp.]
MRLLCSCTFFIRLCCLFMGGTIQFAYGSTLPWQITDKHAFLPKGVYQGSFTMDQSLTYECHPDAVIDAQGQGHALLINTSDITLTNCTVRNWGGNLTNMDSGIFIAEHAHRIQITQNDLQGVGFGIWVDGAADITLLHNRIRGDRQTRSQDRGNGIHLFSVSRSRVSHNHVSDTRDGIYIDVSNHNELSHNTFEDLRYGVHYMFSNNNTVSHNVTRRTRTGYALMQSRNLTVIGNTSDDDENYGILMNYITYSELRHNRVQGVRSGSTGDTMITGAEGKALFIYNSVFNDIIENHFANSALGIHLTAGSERNRVSGNNFINNQQQVKYVATRTQEWSLDGRGNFWSDYLGWDRNADGIGDIFYEPNDNMDRLLWLYPQMRLLMHSPAIELLRWIQQAFPVVKSPGVRDSYPLMRPTTIPTQEATL